MQLAKIQYLKNLNRHISKFSVQKTNRYMKNIHYYQDLGKNK